MEFSKHIVTFRNIARNLRLDAPPNSGSGAGLIGYRPEGDDKDRDKDPKKVPRNEQFLVEPIAKEHPTQRQYFAIKNLETGLYATCDGNLVVMGEKRMPMAIEKLGPPNAKDNRHQILCADSITPLAWALGEEDKGHPVILQSLNPSDENQIWNIDHVAEQSNWRKW